MKKVVIAMATVVIATLLGVTCLAQSTVPASTQTRPDMAMQAQPATNSSAIQQALVKTNFDGSGNTAVPAAMNTAVPADQADSTAVPEDQSTATAVKKKQASLVPPVKPPCYSCINGNVANTVTRHSNSPMTIIAMTSPPIRNQLTMPASASAIAKKSLPLIA